MRRVILFLLLKINEISAWISRWEVRAAHWSHGRVYIGANDGYGAVNWGRLCQNSGVFGLTGENAKSFGQRACHQMGFSRNLFIGNQAAYRRYMPAEDVSFPETIEYIVGGVNCPEGQGDIQECAIKDYRIHGGDCEDGTSDMFIVCSTEKKIIPGKWSDWKMTSPCRPWEDYYSQETRTCVAKKDADDQHSVPYCRGSWLKLTRGCLCRSHGRLASDSDFLTALSRRKKMSCPRIRIETRHPRRPLDLATYKSISLRSVEPDCDPWDIPKWGFPRGTWGDCEADALGDKKCYFSCEDYNRTSVATTCTRGKWKKPHSLPNCPDEKWAADRCPIEKLPKTIRSKEGGYVRLKKGSCVGHLEQPAGANYWFYTRNCQYECSRGIEWHESSYQAKCRFGVRKINDEENAQWELPQYSPGCRKMSSFEKRIFKLKKIRGKKSRSLDRR